MAELKTLDSHSSLYLCPSSGRSDTWSSPSSRPLQVCSLVSFYVQSLIVFHEFLFLLLYYYHHLHIRRGTSLLFLLIYFFYIALLYFKLFNRIFSFSVRTIQFKEGYSFVTKFREIDMPHMFGPPPSRLYILSCTKQFESTTSNTPNITKLISTRTFLLGR